MTDIKKLLFMLISWFLFFAGLAIGWEFYLSLLKEYSK
jgi:hypothetical protein